VAKDNIAKQWAISVMLGALTKMVKIESSPA
jgi:hypothetical protein